MSSAAAASAGAGARRFAPGGGGRAVGARPRARGGARRRLRACAPGRAAAPQVGGRPEPFGDARPGEGAREAEGARFGWAVRPAERAHGDVTQVAALLTEAFRAEPCASGTAPKTLRAMSDAEIERYRASQAASIDGKMLILSQASEYLLLVAQAAEGAREAGGEERQGRGAGEVAWDTFDTDTDTESGGGGAVSGDGASSDDVVGTVEVTMSRSAGIGAAGGDSGGTDKGVPPSLAVSLGLRAGVDWCGVITSMAVARRARRRGVASALLTAVEAAAVERCALREADDTENAEDVEDAPVPSDAKLVLALYVMEDNTAARALYRTRGYVEIGEAASAATAVPLSSVHELRELAIKRRGLRGRYGGADGASRGAPGVLVEDEPPPPARLLMVKKLQR